MIKLPYAVAVLCLLLVLSAATDSNAQRPVLLKNIVPGNTGSFPINLIKSGNILYFAARKPDSGSGFGFYPFRINGQETYLLEDLWLGFSTTTTPAFVDVDGTLFFGGYEPAAGFELWRSDGTPAGTRLVKDIRPGPNGAVVRNLAAVNNTLFFVASDTTYRNKLWKSDGTPEGTVPLTDLSYGQLTLRSVVFKNRYYVFIKAEDERFVRLWQSDGTPTGTVVLKEFAEGELPLYSSLVATDSMLYFSATKSPNAYTLWQSDGTKIGTRPAKTEQNESLVYFNTGCAYQNSLIFNSILTRADGTVTVSLWKYDGHRATLLYDGPELQADFNQATAELNGMLYFVVNSSIIYQTDGTLDGTLPLLKTSVGGAEFGTLGNLSKVGSDLYYMRITRTTGLSIWKTDGTDEHTAAVVELLPVTDNGLVWQAPYWAKAVGDDLYFSFNHPSYGSALWKLDFCRAAPACIPLQISRFR